MATPLALDAPFTDIPSFCRLLLPFVSRALGLTALQRAYARAASSPGATFVERALHALDITVGIDAEALAAVPADGPLIVVANHPHGALDGLALAQAIGRVRPDVRLLANQLLSRIPDMRTVSFFVDPFGGPEAEARCLAGLRASYLWLRNGGALIVFPAGEVAHRVRDGRSVDGEWLSTVGRLAAQTGARVLPLFINGSNSWMFRVAGLVHPRLRTLLLGRELLRQRGTHVTFEVGAAIDASRLPEAVCPSQLTRHLRAQVDRLADRAAAARRSAGAATIADEVRSLPADSLLVSSGRFRVFCTPASRIPRTLHEIGRLRAETFRAAGEGTSAAIDVDRFDRHYLHLFVWDDERARVVGADRLGLVDRLVAAHGIGGLYTSTLFEYGPDLIRQMPRAIELGRSFVRLEYQRQHQPLMLLWRGIGEFVVRHPEYRALVGPASISARYSEASRRTIWSFLERRHLDRERAVLVRGRHPFRASAARDEVHSNGDDVDREVARLESNGNGMPVLLRHYLRLNARVLGCSVDHSFGGVLDVLLVVDLTAVDVHTLRRYLGAGTSGYLSHHIQPGARAA
jgi:putative hemolysin